MKQEPTLKRVGHGGGKSYLVPYRFGRFKIVGSTMFHNEPNKWHVFVADDSNDEELGSFETLDAAVGHARTLWRTEMKL